MGTWAPISPDLAPNATISAIAISPASAKTIAVGTTSGKVQVTTTADQGGSATWTDVSAGLPLRSVSHVTFDPVNASTLYAAFSGFSNFIPTDTMGHVFRSPDLGATWTDISANLPNIPVNDLVVDPDLANTLYVATDIGVFQSTDGGQSWSTLSAGLPHVLVSALNLHRASRTLRAVTYGRSMWDLSVPLPGASQAPHIDAVSPASLAGGAGPVTVTLSGANFAATSAVRWNGSDRPTTFANGKLSITLATADLAAAGRATAMVFNPVAGGSLSNAVNVPVGPAPAATTGGTVSAANPSVSGTLVPGAIESIYGTSLAPGTVVAAAPPLPSTLGGVTVEINGTPAALYFVSPGQINFQTPWEVQGFDRATVSIINGTLTGTSFQVKVADAAPALFSTNGAGTGQGAVLIAGPEVVAAPAGTFPGSRPVQRGEFLEIFGTGLGAVSRYPFDGGTLSGLSITKTPAVTIGGAAATTVLYSGLTPGAVGLYQVNVQVPAGAATGDAVPVFISLSGVTSNSVTIAVR
jgi:uncharacterized protein (TIGR03437 family)